MRAIMLVGALSLAAGACADGGTLAGDGTVAIELAALNLGALTAVSYDITVDGGSPITVDSATYAVTVGEADLVRYVAPCDTAGTGVITVTVNSISVGGTPLATPLPPAQTKTFTCAANTSTAASFSFFALASSQQGFFDVLVGTDVVYCSAKLDCSNSSSFFDGGGGVVLGFACSAGASGAPDTVLHMDDIVIDCGGGPGTVTIKPDVAGNLAAGKITGTSTLIEGATVFRGSQVLSSVENVYWNVAIKLASTAKAATCTLTTHAGATDGATVPVDSAYVAWSVPITTGTGALTCTTHPLFGTSTNAGVAPAWPTFGSAEAFDNTFSGP